jgi:tripartite-type tricarboxylate transporter receptor subunit TctC
MRNHRNSRDFRPDDRTSCDPRKMNWLRSILASFILCLICLYANQSPTWAADWPTRPIKAIVPVAAGSATDSISRLIFDKLSPRIGQPIVIENRPGAGGIIGASMAAKADADGYTWLVIHNAHTMAPTINKNLTYDLKTDFTGVSMLGKSPVVLVVAPTLGVKTVQELVALAKSKPGQLTFATAGFGTPAHIASELFRQSAGIDTRLVPFKSPPEATTETLAGRIDYFFSTIPVAKGLIRDGKLIALAIYGTERSSALPGVPSTIEAGFAKTDTDFWFGLVVPAKTPAAIVAKINADLAATLKDPELQEKLREVGLEPHSMSVNEFNAFLTHELDAAPEIAKTAKLSETQ